MNRFGIPALWSNRIAIFGSNRTGRWAIFQHLWKDKTLFCSTASRCGSVGENTDLLKLIGRVHSRSIHLVVKLRPKKRKVINQLPRNYLINLLFFGRDLPSTNARRPIYGSKNADFRLVFSKKKKQALPLISFRWTQITSFQNLFDPHPPMTSYAKKLKPKNAQIYVWSKQGDFLRFQRIWTAL